MTKGLLRMVLAACLSAVLLPAAPAAAAGKGKGALLGSLAKGTLNNVLGNELSSVLTNLGVFDMLGLGGGSDPVVNAKLDQIINQLMVIQADITDLKSDVATLTDTVIAQSDMAQLQTLLHEMEDASNSIQMCAQQVGLVAKAPGSDASDQQMRSFALQMVGREGGPCDLSNQFSIIHTRIVTDQVLGSAESAVYSLLARVARNKGIEFERIASHFIQYSITQREALELIRGAYSALGEANNLQTVLTQPPSDFLKKLRDEEVAFLVATDTYITGGSPPYDPAPAALADAIVQRLEGVRAQATTYSLSILDDATALTPTLSPPGGASAAPLQLSGTIAGAMSSYYGATDEMLTAGIGSCLATTPSDGFSYVRPMPGAHTGFKIGSSCDLHLERHLLQNVPPQVAADWTVQRRHQAVPVGAYALLNAATLADETAADALALGGSPVGSGSGFSAFTVVPDARDPGVVTLKMTLPGGQPMSIVAGTAHPFVVGAGTAVAFTRVPSGPRYPDRYALRNDAGYLSVGSDGYAALAATPTYFDFQRTPDGRAELVYDGGVLYVDYQYQQLFYGESPDDVFANAANLASGAAAVGQWTIPMDGLASRVQPTSALSMYPPCFDGNGNPSIGYTIQLPAGLAPSTRCSDVGYAYVVYIVTLNNQDSFDRAFRVTIGGHMSPPPAVTGDTVGGMHCWIPNNGTHFDSGGLTKTVPYAPVELPANQYEVTVPKSGSTEMWCEILDLIGQPAHVDFDAFTVQPCKGAAGGTCVVYP